MPKENVDAYDNAIFELAKNLGWSVQDAQYFWEGGEHNHERQKRLNEDIIYRGYRGDSDDLPSFGQFLYDEGILSPDSLKALDLTFISWTYICVWGIGYEFTEPYKALVREHTREELMSDDSYKPDIEEIKNLELGESIQLGGVYEIMTIVRIK